MASRHPPLGKYLLQILDGFVNAGLDSKGNGDRVGLPTRTRVAASKNLVDQLRGVAVAARPSGNRNPSDAKLIPDVFQAVAHGTPRRTLT